MTLSLGPPPTRRLLVEGDGDVRIVRAIVEKAANRRPSDAGPGALQIDDFGGVGNLRGKKGRDLISAELKDPRLTAWGLVRDADAKAGPAWDQVRNILAEHCDHLPKAMPSSGYVGRSRRGVALGIWIMPDCRGGGMIETLLGDMVPTAGSDAELWNYAATACRTARRKQAPFKKAHGDKARLHTWLAWQDEPGKRLDEAILHGKLDVRSDAARGFVTWFERLFPWHGAESG